jgi:hypothetical protein
MDKVGRNDPCPCGSGKKFKKCCEHKTKHKKMTAQILSSAPDSGEVLQQAQKLTSLFKRTNPLPPQEPAHVNEELKDIPL